MKLTKWFDADVKPTRVGVYETKAGPDNRSGFQYWNGGHWRFWGFDIQDAFNCREFGKSCFQNVKWRGLVEDPKAKRRKSA